MNNQLQLMMSQLEPKEKKVEVSEEEPTITVESERDLAQRFIFDSFRYTARATLTVKGKSGTNTLKYQCTARGAKRKRAERRAIKKVRQQYKIQTFEDNQKQTRTVPLNG